MVTSDSHTLLEYKCPSCGAAIKFDSSSQQFKCLSCDSVYTHEQLDAIEQALLGSKAESRYDWKATGEGSELNNVNTYSCQSCGAQIVAEATTAASECPYCNSPIIMTNQLSGIDKPDCVIPFRLNKDAAVDALKAFCKGKRLLPKGFTSDNRVKQMQGVYVPFWLFDCSANANITFDATRTRVWSDKNYNYVETSHYDVFRSGSIAFSAIPADGSTKMDDAYMDGIEPFDYNGLLPFDMGYLSGFLADKYDLDAKACFGRAQTRVENSTQEAFASTVTGYSSVRPAGTSIQTTNGSYKYALMPVWLLNTKYAGKMYTYAINGQTGKVSGELPVDKKKFWMIAGGIAAAIIAVGQFFVL